MGSYRFHVAYDGRGYDGFQSQPSGRGIQDILEGVLAKVGYLEGRVMGASRTDAGVSAYEQICLFQASRDLDSVRVQRSMNALLPPAIRVVSLQKAREGFHPLASSSGKIYRYRLFCGTYLYPFDADLYWQRPRRIEASCLQRELSSVVGLHDFKAFARSGGSQKSTVRHLMDIQIFVKCLMENSVIEIWFHGEGFLRHMVRSLVGSAVDLSLGWGDKGAKSLKDILQTHDRTQALSTAPASPLTLMACLFDNDPRTIGSVRQTWQQTWHKECFAGVSSDGHIMREKE